MKLSALKEALRAKKKKGKKLFLGSGSTLLNLACTGRRDAAYMAGGYYVLIGDSSAGKTVVVGTALAEAVMNPKFNEYEKVFDNVEDGAMMFDKFFGNRVAKEFKPPAVAEDGLPKNSKTVEEFYYNHHKATKRSKNIYGLDSENALTTEAEKDKQNETRKAIEKGKELPGSMTDSKAKLHSQNLRGLIAEVRDTRSIFFMLCQTRDAMGFGAQFEPKTRAGGRALKFYAQLELWFSIFKHITKTVREKEREVGILAQIKVKKNRFTGKNRTILLPIYHSFGIDEVGSCVDYLIAEKHWPKTGGKINAKEFKVTLTRDKLIRYIEDNNQEDQLSQIVEEIWNSIEQECEVHRKSRYV